MEHLNYCRQMVIRLRELISKANSFSLKSGSSSDDVAEIIQHMISTIDLANASKKFILPPGGIVIDDSEFRGLECDGKLSLPFEFIALEYEPLPLQSKVKTFFDEAHGLYKDNMAEISTTKRLLLARHVDDLIVCRQVVFSDIRGWLPFEDFAIKRSGAFHEDGRIKDVYFMAQSPGQAEESGLSYEAKVLISFLNALACSNVRIERSEPKNVGKKIKAALPFDAYHILTIDTPGTSCEIGPSGIGPHRSPREHLRRGHIRRYESGLKIWVNACVVAAGAPGKVSKDYRLRSSEARAQ